MTLFQGRPREVYRVFDEDEFLVRATREDRATPATPLAAEPCVRRIAAATALVAATGALGGLLAMVNVLSVPGTRRRTGVRLFAATASSGALASSSTHVGTVAALRRMALSGGSRESRDVAARERSKRMRFRRRPRPDVRWALERRVASRTLALVTVARSTPVAATPWAGHATPVPGGSGPPGSDRPEFGFER
jgi:hypothetical protein